MGPQSLQRLDQLVQLAFAQLDGVSGSDLEHDRSNVGPHDDLAIRGFEYIRVRHRSSSGGHRQMPPVLKSHGRQTGRHEIQARPRRCRPPCTFDGSSYPPLWRGFIRPRHGRGSGPGRPGPPQGLEAAEPWIPRTSPGMTSLGGVGGALGPNGRPKRNHGSGGERPWLEHGANKIRTQA